MSTPKEALKFHEAERKSHVISHDDFAKEDNFEEFNDDIVIDWLLSKNWDTYFPQLKNGDVGCDVVIINKVFNECYTRFSNIIDTVQMFHLITDFYNVSPTTAFQKLVQLHRKRLVRDLESRIGKMKQKSNAVGSDRIQLAFNLIFNSK